ncbi:hypothetical protein H4Q26_012491 [Puccinia striiformis f. sp. tritici PST-130]|nr:hypothetical protein H4Q26_012491 [Puccinia striiformis f. sp. tritici PST-130]
MERASAGQRQKVDTSNAKSPTAFFPRINLLFGPDSIVGTMNISLLLIPFIIQYLAMGMDPPPFTSRSSFHRHAPCNDVSTYGTMIREHDSPYEIPPPEERAMNTYPAGSSVSPDVTITRTRGESSCKKCLMISFGVTLICSLLIGIIMWLVIGIGSV